jgi:branched-chain amino acid transport system substrate-binding protein
VPCSLGRCLALAAAATVLSAATLSSGAAAERPERIAFVGALSGPDAFRGRDQRDGVLLALAEQERSRGGMSVRVVEFDDRGEARHAVIVADRILAERIKLVTGLTTIESALALNSRLIGKSVVLLSSGAGPLALAAEKCSSSFFSTAPVEDAVHENAGLIARARGYKTIYIVTSQESGVLVKTAFQRSFPGVIAGVHDAQHAIAQIRQLSPEAVYVALPASESRSFLKSYREVGLFHLVPVIASDDGALLEGLGREFSGLMVSARWSAATETERSKQFVAAFERRYGRKPSVYAMQGYDSALLLGEALRNQKLKAMSTTAVRRMLAAQSVEGVTGPLRFAANGFPITGWHAWEVFNDSYGATYLGPREPTLQEYTDPHSERCKVN